MTEKKTKEYGTLVIDFDFFNNHNININLEDYDKLILNLKLESKISQRDLGLLWKIMFVNKWKLEIENL